MIDGPTYRLSQTLARRQISTWELAQIHHVVFEHQAFPNGINSTQELTQVMNIMQENRFDAYVQEWGGLSESDIELLSNALVDYVHFCKSHFPQSKIKLPLSTMISSLSLYKKLTGYNPNFSKLLEIGSGPGNLTFFLKQHKPLTNYSSVEACEAYYLLQNIVNQHNFGIHFEERAFPQEQETALNTFTQCKELEEPTYIDFEPTPKSIHYPWWRLGELAEQEKYFDIVTSNANLMEFSHHALIDYLGLVKRVLTDDGVLLCQCLGGSVQRRTKDLIPIMKEQGIGALMISTVGDSTFDFSGATHPKYFCLRNAVFVKEGHPLYSIAMEQMHFEYPVFTDNHQPLVDAFFDSQSNKKKVTPEDIVQRVTQKLNPTNNTTHKSQQLEPTLVGA